MQIVATATVQYVTNKGDNMFKIKKLSREQQIINLISRKEGASNFELNKIMFRYGAVIHNLRKDGYHIDTICIKRGLYRYYMGQ